MFTQSGKVFAFLVLGCSCALYSTAATRHTVKSRAPKAASPAVVTTVGDQLTFQPPTIVIKRGQTVEWQNQSSQLHNVTIDPAKAVNGADVESPKGATPFDSGFLKPAQNYSHRFTVPGTYHYVCTLHEVQGMKGEIVVK